MKETKADIILHPVRMRIIQTLIGGQQLTVQEMMESLPEVPQATLYRHLKKLVDADLLIVVEENQIRGTVEKVYALPKGANELTEEEMLSLDREDHMNLFLKFMTNLLADYERYLSQEQFNLKEDGVGYRQARFYASDEEFFQLVETVAKAMSTLLNNKPSADRKKRIFTTIIMPESDERIK